MAILLFSSKAWYPPGPAEGETEGLIPVAGQGYVYKFPLNIQLCVSDTFILCFTL